MSEQELETKYNNIRRLIQDDEKRWKELNRRLVLKKHEKEEKRKLGHELYKRYITMIGYLLELDKLKGEKKK